MRATFKKNLNLGFTLAELLGVLIILAIVATIAIPIVNKSIKSSKEKLYNSQLEEIKNSAEKWAYSNIDLLPNNDGESITITIYELKKSGLLSLDVRNPKTGELLPNDMVITITFKNNNYEIYVDGESGSDIDNEVNNNSPILILNGNFIEYVEINSNYEEKGAIAKDKDGNQIEDIQISYQLNGVEVPSIDTGSFNTYTAIYSATSEEYTSKVTRTIVIRDTTAPDLIVPGTTEVYLNELDSFNLLEGVSATDNSGEGIYIETRGFDRLPTDKIVEYTACDSHNNCITKRRLIKVIDEEIFAMDPVNFDYTGGEQIFEVPHSGYYKFEVWGAQGGGNNSGYGGYSTGVIYLNETNKIYINVGGTTTNGTGGYNGGGTVTGNLYGGGGATHISNVSGLLSSLSSKKEEIIIVAGGGGGRGNGYAGGSGGGATGCNGTGNDYGKDATQTSGGGVSSNLGASSGSFGKGGNASWSNEAIGGGGGGYYGGGSGGGNNNNGGGGGGSGYIGNSNLIQKSMYCYNCATSDAESTRTYSTTNVSENPISQYAKIGNGYVKITYVGENL